MQARSRQQEELEAVALIEQEVAVERRDAAQNLADALDACKQATAKYGEEKQLVEQLRLQLKQQIATCMTEQKQHSDELSKSLSDSDRFSDEAARAHAAQGLGTPQGYHALECHMLRHLLWGVRVRVRVRV